MKWCVNLGRSPPGREVQPPEPQSCQRKHATSPLQRWIGWCSLGKNSSESYEIYKYAFWKNSCCILKQMVHICSELYKVLIDFGFPMELVAPVKCSNERIQRGLYGTLTSVWCIFYLEWSETRRCFLTIDFRLCCRIHLEEGPRRQGLELNCVNEEIKSRQDSVDLLFSRLCCVPGIQKHSLACYFAWAWNFAYRVRERTRIENVCWRCWREYFDLRGSGRLE